MTSLVPISIDRRIALGNGRDPGMHYYSPSRMADLMTGAVLGIDALGSLGECIQSLKIAGQRWPDHVGGGGSFRFRITILHPHDRYSKDNELVAEYSRACTHVLEPIPEDVSAMIQEIVLDAVGKRVEEFTKRASEWSEHLPAKT